MNLENGACKMVVAEDEHIIANDIARSLTAFGYQVSGLADSGPEALRLVEQTCPDLVLMDIRLRGSMDGIAAAAEVRRRWQIPVVFLTSFADVETITRAKTAGPYGYVMKPFRATELNATLRVAVHQHRLGRELFAEHDWLRTLLTSISDGVIAADIRGARSVIERARRATHRVDSCRCFGKAGGGGLPAPSMNREPLENVSYARVLDTGQPAPRQCVHPANPDRQRGLSSTTRRHPLLMAAAFSLAPLRCLQMLRTVVASKRNGNGLFGSSNDRTPSWLGSRTRCLTIFRRLCGPLPVLPTCLRGEPPAALIRMRRICSTQSAGPS